MDEIIKYTTEGLGNLEVRLDEGTVWLTQVQIADLFGTQRPAITKHINNIFLSGELNANSVCSILEHTAKDGKQYQTKFYNLDAIISVGYRVNSKRATQFRIWATDVLCKHLLKGYTIRQPTTMEQLTALKQDVDKQLIELREQIEELDIVVDTQYNELHKVLIELTSQKKLQEEQKQPRRKIGFQHYLEPKS